MVEVKQMVARELAIGEVAQRSGLSVSALHFYERKGLIHSLRTSGNQRRYQRDVLRRLAAIRIAQRVGIPLEAVVTAFATLPDTRTPTRADWARLSASWRDELEQRITQLQQLKEQFTDCIGCGCLSLRRCRLSNPDDTLGLLGDGPQRLSSGGG
jgi:MerR family redox-sensitive transcriptional activator SoxR